MAHVNKDALVDKLCERLAAETGGVEIYQAALAKIEDPELVARLERFARDELAHRQLVAAHLDRLGVENRTTPSARIARHETDAFLRLIGEAETPAHVLNVLLTFELMDETAWEMIIDLGRDVGDEELVRSLGSALRDEKQHLRGVRGMLVRVTRALVIRPDSELQSSEPKPKT
jgi:rubrerythrin